MNEAIAKLEARLQQQWQRCRWGVPFVLSNEKARSLVINWMNDNWGEECPWRCFWLEILSAQHLERKEQLLKESDYKNLSLKERGFWRPRISSAPWVVLKFSEFRKNFDEQKIN